MLATVRAALDEAEAVAGEPAGRVAAAISFGALMGARGNSGVITSQIFRGMAEGLGGKKRFNGLDLAHALNEGAKTAYGAVAKPVEGTILTVIRESAAGAVEVAERDNDIETVLGATVAAAEKAVARTPSLLAILREAGVVDAGGQGLYRLFQGALLHLTGRTPVGVARDRSTTGPKPSTLVAHADEGFGYETMFLLRATGHQPLDVDAIRDHLESIGESVLVAGDSRALKVHVHNERPDLVIGYGLSLGDMSRITRRESRQPGPGRPRDARGGVHRRHRRPQPTEQSIARRDRGDASGGNGTGPAAELPGLAVIAVTAGDGLAAIFRDFGVASVVQGGQSANPSTGELLEAVQAVEAREVLLLPEQPERRARSAAGRADERPPGPASCPTRNAAEGFAALLALDPGMDAAANVGPMTEAGRAIQTVVVTEAVRDATIGGRKVKRGQTIALDPGRRPHRGRRETATKCVLAAMAALPPGLRARDAVLRRRRRPRRDRGDGAQDRRRSCPASRSRSATAASPSTGTSSRPSRRPRWREPRPRLDQAGGDPAAADRPGRAAANAAGPFGPDRGAALLRRAGHPAGLVRRPRPAVPPAAPLRRPARAAHARRPASGPRRGRSSRPGSGSTTSASSTTFRRRVQRTIARLTRRHRRGRRDVVRPALHRAAPARGRDGSSCQGRLKRFGRDADDRQPGVPGDRRRRRGAPRRPDRAGLPADGRADRGAPAGRDARGARPGRRTPTRSTCRASFGARSGSSAIADGARGGALPGVVRGTRRGARAASRSTSCSRSSSAWSAGGGRAAATARRASRSDDRRPTRSIRVGAGRRARRDASAARSS